MGRTIPILGRRTAVKFKYNTCIKIIVVPKRTIKAKFPLVFKEVEVIFLNHWL